MTPLKVVAVPVERLIPYAMNARTHSEEQVAQIAASIKAFGWTNPVLIDGDKGIIAGHGRLAAARKLEMTEVPCIELAHLSEAEKKALILADNKLAMNAGWDNDVLKLELENLDSGLQGLVGFSEDELNVIFNGWQSDIEVPDDLTDDSKTQLKVKVEKEQGEWAKEVITNALDAAGIDYEL
jgi:hypothetical protein